MISFFGLEGKNKLLVFGRQFSIPKISFLHLLDFARWSGRLTIAQTDGSTDYVIQQKTLLCEQNFVSFYFCFSPLSFSQAIDTEGGHKTEVSCSQQSSDLK